MLTTHWTHATIKTSSCKCAFRGFHPYDPDWTWFVAKISNRILATIPQSQPSIQQKLTITDHWLTINQTLLALNRPWTTHLPSVKHSRATKWYQPTVINHKYVGSKRFVGEYDASTTSWVSKRPDEPKATYNVLGAAINQLGVSQNKIPQSSIKTHL